MNKLNIIVCGGRDYNNYSFLTEKLNELAPTFVIQGGAKGADFLAKKYCIDNNISFNQIDAKWDLYGLSAGPKRNKEMLDLLLSKEGEKLVVAFPGGKGTLNMINQAKSFSIKVIEFNK